MTGADPSPGRDAAVPAGSTAGSAPGARSRPYAFGLLAAGSLAALIAAGRPWWSGAADTTSVAFSGTQSTGGLASAVPFVLLAGTLLALALRSGGRRVVAVLLALTAFGGVLLGALRPRPPQEVVRDRLQSVTLGTSAALHSGVASYLFGLAALAALAGAVVMALRAATWPSAADRFERPAGSADTAGVPAAGRSEPSGTALWSALDAGLDPTDRGGDGQDAGGDEADDGGAEVAPTTGSAPGADPAIPEPADPRG